MFLFVWGGKKRKKHGELQVGLTQKGGILDVSAQNEVQVDELKDQCCCFFSEWARVAEVEKRCLAVAQGQGRGQKEWRPVKPCEAKEAV